MADCNGGPHLAEPLLGSDLVEGRAGYGISVGRQTEEAVTRAFLAAG